MCINKNIELLPYYEKAKELLIYRDNEGVFVRRVKRGKHEKGSIAGSVNNVGYHRISIVIDRKAKKLLSHRLAWFISYGELPNVIDHIDRNKLNNKLNNLRSVTNQQNLMGMKGDANSSTGIKGVGFRSDRGKWRAQIGFNGKYIHIGTFNCMKKASEAYEAKAKELFGEFYKKPITCDACKAEVDAHNELYEIPFYADVNVCKPCLDNCSGVLSLQTELANKIMKLREVKR